MKNPFLKHFLIFSLICSTVAVSAQDVIEIDTIRSDKDPGRLIDISAGNEVSRPPNLLEKSILFDSENAQARALSFPKFDADPAAKLRIDHETVTLTPYNYSFYNSFEGVTMQGISGRFVFNDFLTANLNYFISSMYFGPFQPNPYINNSLQMSIDLRVHDRVQLVGLGGVSVREGLDPRMSTFLGGSNYFGAGMKVKVTDKFGFGFGVTRSFFRGNWTSRPYVVPAFFK
ncbi:MAG: hypothetical protein LBE79_10335 [Tannerella sp.]|jgi:hypothetical protein|nr:hypothetical protein [Tannerella sp.]